MDIQKLLENIEHPDVVDALYSIYENAILTDNSDLFFRFDFAIKRDIEKMLAEGGKPWFKYPLSVLSPIESPDALRGYLGTKYESNFHRAVEDIDELNQVYKKAIEGGINSIDWWILPHMCFDINGTFLYSILRVTYPEKRFYYIKTDEHGYVEDEEGKIYDLYWSIYNRENQYHQLTNKKIHTDTEYSLMRSNVREYRYSALEQSRQFFEKCLAEGCLITDWISEVRRRDQPLYRQKIEDGTITFKEWLDFITR